MNLFQQLGAVLVVFGGVSWKWGRTRSTVLDDRGPAWEIAYRIARVGGPALALLGALLAGGGTVFQ